MIAKLIRKYSLGSILESATYRKKNINFVSRMPIIESKIKHSDDILSKKILNGKMEEK